MAESQKPIMTINHDNLGCSCATSIMHPDPDRRHHSCSRWPCHHESSHSSPFVPQASLLLDVEDKEVSFYKKKNERDANLELLLDELQLVIGQTICFLFLFVRKPWTIDDEGRRGNALRPSLSILPIGTCCLLEDRDRGTQKYEQNKPKITGSRLYLDPTLHLTIMNRGQWENASPFFTPPPSFTSSWPMTDELQWKRSSFFFAWAVLLASAGVRGHARCVSWRWRRKGKMREWVSEWMVEEMVEHYNALVYVPFSPTPLTFYLLLFFWQNKQSIKGRSLI